MDDACNPADMNLVAKGIGGTVEFDGATVSIIRAGISRFVVGKGTKRIPVRQLTAVQWKNPGPLVNGFIQFTIAGSVERRSQFGHQTWDAGLDENSVVFTSKQKRAFEQIRQAIEDAMAGGIQPQQQYPMPPAPGAADRMGELQRMLAEGTITPTEFDLKRQEILRQL